MTELANLYFCLRDSLSTVGRQDEELIDRLIDADKGERGDLERFRILILQRAKRRALEPVDVAIFLEGEYALLSGEIRNIRSSIRAGIEVDGEILTDSEKKDYRGAVENRKEQIEMNRGVYSVLNALRIPGPTRVEDITRFDCVNYLAGRIDHEDTGWPDYAGRSEGDRLKDVRPTRQELSIMFRVSPVGPKPK